MIAQKCGIENSTQQTVVELNGHINDAARAHHDFHIATLGDRYAVLSDTVTTANGVASYEITATIPQFYSLLSARLEIDDWSFPLSQFSLIDSVTVTSGTSWGPGFLPRYTIVRDPGGDVQLIFDRPPDTANTVRLYFHSAPPEYTLDGDMVEIPNVDLLIIEAAIRVRMKERVDYSDFLAERAYIRQRLESEAGSVDRGEPWGTLRAKRRRSTYDNRAF